MASKPKTMQEAIEMATELMDRRINTLAERQAENKRKFEDAPRNNQNQQPNKRQNTGRAPGHFRKDAPIEEQEIREMVTVVARAYAWDCRANPNNTVVTAQARARRASEENIGVVEERGVVCKFPSGILDFLNLQAYSLNQKELNMKTTRWLSCYSDYIAYSYPHPGKANVLLMLEQEKNGNPTEAQKPRTSRMMMLEKMSFALFVGLGGEVTTHRSRDSTKRTPEKIIKLSKRMQAVRDSKRATLKFKRLENLIDQRVKVIRCDNGTEFKNKEMNQFCERKGIKREFSVARTPQQNGVAERKNRTLIEAARTMLADSKLPTTFWAEAVNTACYVQNRVLVTKPHNKTPYELFLGRKPTLGFMKPFGYPVTILNTIDHLGKFDGKADEGFFVGYSINSKAFRVFNSRTRIVEENMHVQFSNNTPNIVGSRPNWLFDIDALTKSKPSSDDEKKVDEDPSQDSESINQDKDDNDNSTNNVNAASTNEEELAQFKLQEVWTLVDLPNGKRPIGTKWVFGNKKDERGNVIKNKARLVAQGYIQEEGIDYDEVFAHVARIEAIRLFLAYASFKDFVVYQMDVKSAFLYGKIEEEVYICQPRGFKDPNFPDRVYKVEKALYGLHQALRAWYETLLTYLLDNGFQRGKIDKTLFIRRDKVEEGIDYDEIFAPVSIIEAIRLFLVYALFKYFVVYQMDVKSAFLYGKIEQEVYVCQPLGFEDPDFPNRVYKVEKALYGLHQAPRAWYEALSTYLLDNGFQRGKIDKTLFIKRDKEFEKMMHKKFQMSSIGELAFFLGLTPMETQTPLLKDEDGEEVDVHLYRSMVGSLMYLTSLRSDIMFSCKKQTMVANSTTEAEYVAASSCCGQVLWIQNQLLDYGDSNEKKLIQMIKIHTDKNVADLLTKAFDKGIGVNAGDSKLMLLGINLLLLGKVNAARHNLLLLVVKTVNGEQQLQALVDRKKIIITEATVRRDLQLEDADGLDMPTDPHHTPTIIPPSTSQPQRKQRPRKPKRKDTEIPQSSVPMENVADKAVYEERDDSLERATTTATGLDAEQDRVLDLENTKTAQAREITSLKKRVKKLERKKKSRTHGLKRLYKVGMSARIDSSDDEASLGDQEDASKQGRKIHDIDADEDIALKNVHDADMFGVHDLDGDEVFIETEEHVVNAAITTSTIPVSAAKDLSDVDMTLAQALAELKSTKPKAVTTC
ncbi:retrovirus-related pol polyprotein from transposon TNT 1-94 [Tanacetum coccineum]